MIETVYSLQDLAKAIEKDVKQLNFAAIVALTRVAKIAVTDNYSVMRRVFDRPTPATLNSLFVKPATKIEPEPYAEIRFKDSDKGGKSAIPFTKYLTPEIEGGQRHHKGLERSLNWQFGGQYYWMPTRLMPLDQYGNIRRQTASKILGDIVGHNMGSSSNISTTGKNRRTGAKQLYFMGQTKAGKPAIFAPRGQIGKTFPVLIATNKAQYKKRLPFFETIQAAWDNNMDAQYDKALKEFL